MKKLGKKGVIDQLTPMVIALVAVGIVLTVGFLIVAEGKSQIADIDAATIPNMGPGNGSYGYNASMQVESALSDIPGWLPIIVITMIGALLIGLVSFFKAR